MVGTVVTGRGGRPLHVNAANGTDLDAADQHHSDLAVRTTTRSPQISGLMGVLWAHVLYLIHIEIARLPSTGSSSKRGRKTAKINRDYSPVSMHVAVQSGMTALHGAAAYGKDGCLKLLIEAGANIEAVSNVCGASPPLLPTRHHRHPCPLTS